MKEECLVCKKPIVYLESEKLMECVFCHKQEYSRTMCQDGHYVCNQCHSGGIDAIVGKCLMSESKDPFEIICNLMDMDFCHMHGPEHHIMVGASLLTAYKNAGANINLEEALHQMIERGKEVPGGACGFWGACGAGISTGIFISIITKSTPLSSEPWGMANRMTSAALEKIGKVGGPRCCKRDSFLSILAAIDFVKENFGIEMKKSTIQCRYFPKNNQCLGAKCPFHPGK